MDVQFKKYDFPQSGVAVFLVADDLKLGSELQKSEYSAHIKRAINGNKSFDGKIGSILPVYTTEGLEKIVLVGVGDPNSITPKSLNNIGGKIFNYLNSLKYENGIIVIENSAKWKKLSLEDVIYNLTLGAKLRSYNFDHYFVDKKDEHKNHLKKIDVLVPEIASIKGMLEKINAIAGGVFLTRDLVSQPANILYPKTFMEQCKKLSKLGVKVTVLNQRQMKKLGMNALLGVAQGSIHEPYLVVMQWNGGKKSDKPVAFVGKGVTFDSGGISIKPSAGMADMKYDMGGAGTVTGLMHTVAARKAKTNVIGVIGLVENMPSGSAQRPSDVVKSMSGQTIEIDNTDAEGRLVLADALWYTQQKYKPEFMIDLATLTGAVVIALGENINAGMFSNDEKLAEKLLNSSEKTSEGLWRLPLGEEYDSQINSEIADVKNTGQGRGAGTITAAQFLKRFVNNCNWAHLDIAGMAWNKKGSDISPKGATGYGVRLLNQLVEDYYG